MKRPLTPEKAGADQGDKCKQGSLPYPKGKSCTDCVQVSCYEEEPGNSGRKTMPAALSPMRDTGSRRLTTMRREIQKRERFA